MWTLCILAIAGAAGTLARYTLGGWAHQWLGSQFPYGTLVVNLAGCLTIGFLGTLSDERSLFSSEVRIALFIGFLGALTTYSSVAYETWAMLKDGEVLVALLNVFGGFAACFAGLFLGVLLARLT
ncbi:MAG: fluoride efflux transporter CrcB [Deltaproteobacteria bacterium]|nr:fluoride efflux transporter CrcB [Deltaproteobacteria bacterium]